MHSLVELELVFNGVGNKERACDHILHKKTIVSSLLKEAKGEVILIGVRSRKLYRLQMKVIILKAWSLKIGQNHSKCYIFWNFI